MEAQAPLTHTEKVTHLTTSELTSLSALHAANLPGSLVTALGLPAISVYYSFILSSNLDHLFIARREGTIVGACMLSSAPHSLTRRFVTIRPFAVLPRLALSSITSKSTRKALRDVFTSHDLPPQITGLSEVVQIFVDGTCRGAGIGRILLEGVERYLSGEMNPSYFLKTLADPSNRAVGFYERLGFEKLSTVTLSGKPYLFLLKKTEFH